MNLGDIINVNVNGQYEFGKIHYISNDGKYIGLTMYSGCIVGGRLNNDIMTISDGIDYQLRVCTGKEPGYDSAVEFLSTTN